MSIHWHVSWTTEDGDQRETLIATEDALDDFIQGMEEVEADPKPSACNLDGCFDLPCMACGIPHDPTDLSCII